VFQVPPGQPEVILRPVSLEPDKVFWSAVRTDQSVGDDILHLEFFFVIHQLRGWGLAGRAHVRRPGMIGFQVFHVLEWGQSGEPRGNLHPNSVRPADLQHCEGSEPSWGQFLARELQIVVLCT
jgi:hypothetical protein